MKLDPLPDPLVLGDILQPCSLGFWRRRGDGALRAARRASRPAGELFSNSTGDAAAALRSARDNYTHAARLVIVARIMWGDLRAAPAQRDDGRTAP